MSKVNTKNLFSVLSEDDEEENKPEPPKPKPKPQKPTNSDDNEPQVEGFQKVNKKKKKKKPKQTTNEIVEQDPSIMNWEFFPRDIFQTILNFLFLSLSLHPRDKYRIPGFWKICSICKNWNKLANARFWKLRVEKFNFGTQEQRALIMVQPEEKQAALWKKMYREWMRETEKKEWVFNKYDSHWLEEYEGQKDTRTYKKNWDVW